MKTIFKTALLLGILCPFIADAQYVDPKQVASMKKWKASSWNIGLATDNDHFESMSREHVLSFAKDPQELHRNLEGFDEEVTTVTFGMAIYGRINLSPLDPGTGEYSDEQEWQIGLGLHSDKEAMISYKQEDLDTSIVYCNVHSELTLETAYVWKGKWGRNWHWYIGGGVSGGITFGNQMILISGRYFEPGQHPSVQEAFEVETEFYEARQVYYSRIYVPYGIHHKLGKRSTIGFDFRRGIGVQAISGEKANFIKRTGAFIISARIPL